jgi:hypothetical protein
MRRTEFDYTVEKTVETLKILEVLEFTPATLDTIIKRVGFIPHLNRVLKKDAVRRILLTCGVLGYAKQDEMTKRWSKGYRHI